MWGASWTNFKFRLDLMTSKTNGCLKNIFSQPKRNDNEEHVTIDDYPGLTWHQP